MTPKKSSGLPAAQFASASSKVFVSGPERRCMPTCCRHSKQTHTHTQKNTHTHTHTAAGTDYCVGKHAASEPTACNKKQAPLQTGHSHNNPSAAHHRQHAAFKLFSDRFSKSFVPGRSAYLRPHYASSCTGKQTVCCTACAGKVRCSTASPSWPSWPVLGLMVIITGFA